MGAQARGLAANGMAFAPLERGRGALVARGDSSVVPFRSGGEVGGGEVLPYGYGRWRWGLLSDDQRAALREGGPRGDLAAFAVWLADGKHPRGLPASERSPLEVRRRVVAAADVPERSGGTLPGDLSVADWNNLNADDRAALLRGASQTATATSVLQGLTGATTAARELVTSENVRSAAQTATEGQTARTVLEQQGATERARILAAALAANPAAASLLTGTTAGAPAVEPSRAWVAPVAVGGAGLAAFFLWLAMRRR